MAEKAISTSCKRGDATAEHHDRREYTPDNVEPTLTERNVTFVDAGDFKSAVNAEFAPEIAAYNAKQKRKDRKKSADYYSKVLNNGNDDKPVIEYVWQFGNRKDCGVCDNEFDKKEWKRLQEEDEQNGTRTASEYVAEHLSTGEKGQFHDDARAMCIKLAEELKAGHHCPPGMKIIGLWLHDDEPSGTPHLHMAFIPIGEGYKTDLARRVSIGKCFEAAGYKYKETAVLEWQREVRDEVMIPIMRSMGYERRDMENEETPLPIDEFRTKEAVKDAKAQLAETQAEQATAEVARDAAKEETAAQKKESERLEHVNDLRRADRDALREEISSILDDRDEADARIEKAEDKEIEAESAEEKANRAWAQANAEKRDAERTVALAGIMMDGYQPPVGIRVMTRAEMPDDLRRAIDSESDDYGEMLDAYPADEWTLDGDDVVFIDVPDDALGMDDPECSWEDVCTWYRERVEGQISLAREAGIDPYEPCMGMAEREAAVEQREAAVGQAEADIEPSRRAVKAREDVVSVREDRVKADAAKNATQAKQNASDAAKNAADKAANDKRKKELDEQAAAQKEKQAKIDSAETDAQGVRDRANVYARLRVEQADEAAGETRFERLRKNPLKVFAHQLATLSDGLYAGGHSIAGRLASELGDVLDRMGEGFGKRLNDLLRRGLDEALMPEPTGADVALEQMAHKTAPVAPASPQAWAAAGRYSNDDAHVEGLNPDEPYDPYAIEDSGRDDDTIEYYG